MPDKSYSKQIRQANFMANPKMCAQMELTRALFTRMEECGIEPPENFTKFQWVNALKVQYWPVLASTGNTARTERSHSDSRTGKKSNEHWRCSCRGSLRMFVKNFFWGSQ